MPNSCYILKGSFIFGYSSHELALVFLDNKAVNRSFDLKMEICYLDQTRSSNSAFQILRPKSTGCLGMGEASGKCYDTDSRSLNWNLVSVVDKAIDHLPSELKKDHLVLDTTLG